MLWGRVTRDIDRVLDDGLAHRRAVRRAPDKAFY
ncbi:MAG: hypothetical protein UZ13_00870, partial [Chloroflexi bacterium OLB13]